MKHKLLLLLTLWTALLSTASAQTAAWYLTTKDNNAFIVTLNGRTLNAEPVRDLFISSMPSGKHNFEVTVLFPGLNPVTITQQVTLTANLESLFEVRYINNAWNFVGTGTKPRGQVNHSSHPTFTLTTQQGGSFAAGQFTINSIANNYNPTSNVWDENIGWPDLYVAPTPDPTPIPAATGDTTCSNPMTAEAFNAALARIKSKTIESTKLAIAKDVIEGNCFTAAQVKEILLTFTSDNSRVDLGKLAWHHLNDPRNWGIVYDAFTYGDRIEQLKSYVKLHPLTTPKKPVPAAMPLIASTWPLQSPFTVEHTATTATFTGTVTGVNMRNTTTDNISLFFNGKQVLNYTWNPVTNTYSHQVTLQRGDNTFQVNATNAGGTATLTQVVTLPEAPKPIVYVPGYEGPVGCDKPLDATEFSTLQADIRKVTFSSDRYQYAQDACNANCFTADQCRKIMEMFTFGSERLTLAKILWEHCYDIDNFYKVYDLFSFTSETEELEEFVAQHPRGNRLNTGCTTPMGATQFADMKASISKVSSNNRINPAKQAMNNKCFSAAQIREIMGLFTWDSEKTEIAKLCWKNCTDPKNYYQLKTSYTFSSEWAVLEKYMKDNPR